MPPLRLRPDGILDPQARYPNPLTGEPYSQEYKDAAINIKNGENKGWSAFITWQQRNEIFTKLHNNQIMLILAPTGVGKTVIVPKLMLHYFGYKTPIIVTTPRQKSTQEAAQYAAYLMDVPLDKLNPLTNEKEDTGYRQVGYKFMGAQMYDDSTKLLFSTDGSIRVMMTKTDPDLEKYGGIIIDEAHERSASIDILLGLVMELCNRRPNFKVVIMSATANSQTFIDYFKTLGISNKFTKYEPEGVPGNYKSIQQFNNQPVTPMEAVDLKVGAGAILHNLLKDTTEMDKLQGPDNITSNGKKYFKYGRDILVFVATEKQCMDIKKMVEYNWTRGEYKYKPFVGILTANTDEYNNSIMLKENGLTLIQGGQQDYKFKIMVSTPVAESSITFKDPLAYVLESGTQWFVWYDPLSYGTLSFLDFTARANIMQRCGRTGRINDGYCNTAYTEDQYLNKFKKFPDADILHKDLTDELLGLILLPQIGNITNCLKFLSRCIEPVGNYKDSIKIGFKNLLEYDCVDMYGKPTPLGHLCAKFGLFNYQQVRMIAIGYYLGVLKEAIYMAALLSLRGYEDIFNVPLGKLEDPAERMRQFKILKTFLHPTGEHLSLLNLYLRWLHTPHFQRVHWEKFYNINGRKMQYISTVITELTEMVVENIDEIRGLNLIKVYPAGGQSGGGYRGTKTATQNGYNFNDMQLKNIYEPPTMLPYVMSLDKYAVHYGGGGPGDKGNYYANISDDTYKMLEEYELDMAQIDKPYGKHINKPVIDKKLYKHFKKIKIGGKIINKSKPPLTKHMQGGGPWKGKGGPPNIAKSPQTILLEKKNAKLKELIDGDKLSLKGLFQGVKIPDLGPVQQLSLDERMMLCIYFGYCTHIAIIKANADTKKYYAKFSNKENITIKGTEKRPSFLDSILNVRPNFIIYKDLSVSEQYDSTFSTASVLPIRVMDLIIRARANN